QAGLDVRLGAAPIAEGLDEPGDSRLVAQASRSDGARPLAVHEAGEENGRTQSLAFFDRVADGADEVELVAAVAHGRHAGGEIERSPLDLLEMGVHVPETGEDRLPLHVDPAGARRNGDGG